MLGRGLQATGRKDIRRMAARWGPAVLITALALLAAPWLVGPSCPKHVIIATGAADGAYYEFAQKYREILAKQGITLEVRQTAGSVENIRLLDSNESGVSLALVQGGTASSKPDASLQSLASLYLEPVWVFCRSEKPVTSLLDLRGRRIAIGPQGSGTRAIAHKLLSDNHMLTSSEDASETEVVDWGGNRAVEGLKSGHLDAAFFVISPESQTVAELLDTEGIRLVNFRRAAAYRSKYPYLSSVTLPQGLMNLEENIPSGDVTLVAPAANLVAREDLHPALIPLLLKTAAEVHESAGLLASGESFPSPNFVDFRLHDDARRFFRSGPSLFYRYLPFQLAAWVDRVKLMLLPMCTLLFPLLKAAPPLYRWRIRSKIYRWYRVLREVDQKLKDASVETDFSPDIANLKTMEHELAEVSVPLSYMQEFYNLRLHVAFVLGRLESNRTEDQNAPADQLRAAA